MIFRKIEDFRAAIPNTGRLLGLDLGTQTIGLALTDAGRGIATPIDTLKRTKLAKDLQQLSALIQKEQIAGLVLGYPVNMDGSEGPRCQATRQFAKDAVTSFKLAVLLWDERMSTMAVEKVLLEADLSRQKRAEHVDKLAAAYILQGVLDYMKVRG